MWHWLPQIKAPSRLSYTHTGIQAPLASAAFMKARDTLQVSEMGKEVCVWWGVNFRNYFLTPKKDTRSRWPWSWAWL